MNKQSGSALIICLIFLLLLTMMGVGAMQSATMQEKMVGNAVDENRAFQYAEGALRAGEAYVQANNLTISSTDISAVVPTVGATPSSPWASVDVSGKTAYYYITKLSYADMIFRITAIGYGVDSNSRVVLQSTYRPE